MNKSNKLEDWIEIRDLFKVLDRYKRSGFDKTELCKELMIKGSEYSSRYGKNWSIAEIPDGYEKWRLENDNTT